MVERRTTTGYIHWDERATGVENVHDPTPPDERDSWQLVASCASDLRYSKQTICWFWEREPPSIEEVPIPDGSNIPRSCNHCGTWLRLENLFVDDGCPCNSRRGINFEPLPCSLCKTDCVKPGHHLEHLFGGVATVLRSQVIMECEEVVGKYADAQAERGNKDAAVHIHAARRELRALKEKI